MAAALTFYSCESTDKQALPDDITDREIIQLAQNAIDKNKKDLAEYYYKVLLQRYGNYTYDYVEGRFELAHLYLKQKKYDQAVPMLEEILEIYDTSTPGSLPGEYKILAKLDLEKVPEKKMAEIRTRIANDAEAGAAYGNMYPDDEYEDESEYYDPDAYYYDY